MSRQILRWGRSRPPQHHAASFDGNAYLTNANSGGALKPSGGLLEFGCWFIFDTITSGVYHKIVDMSNGDGTPANFVAGLQIDGTTGKIELVSSNGSAYSTIETATTPVTGHWYYALCRCSGSANEITLYDLAGEIEGGLTASSGVQAVTQPLRVGNGAETGAVGIIGAVDSLGWWPGGAPTTLTDPPSAAPIWNSSKAIDAKQVLAIDATHLAAFYNFDSFASAATWVDDSGNGNALTATGVVTSRKGAGY